VLFAIDSEHHFRARRGARIGLLRQTDEAVVLAILRLLLVRYQRENLRRRYRPCGRPVP
jgi:hypothetical protein